MAYKRSSKKIVKKSLKKSYKKGGASKKRSNRKNSKRSSNKVKKGGSLTPRNPNKINYLLFKNINSDNFMIFNYAKNIFIAWTKVPSGYVYERDKMEEQVLKNFLEKTGTHCKRKMGFLGESKHLSCFGNDEEVNEDMRNWHTVKNYKLDTIRFQYSEKNSDPIVETFNNKEYIKVKITCDNNRKNIETYIKFETFGRIYEYLLSNPGFLANNSNLLSEDDLELYLYVMNNAKMIQEAPEKKFEAYVWDKNGWLGRKTKHKCYKKEKCEVMIKIDNNEYPKISFCYGICGNNEKQYTLTNTEVRYAQKKIVLVAHDENGKRKDFDLTHEDFSELCANLYSSLPEKMRRQCTNPNKNIRWAKY